MQSDEEACFNQVYEERFVPTNSRYIGEASIMVLTNFNEKGLLCRANEKS